MSEEYDYKKKLRLFELDMLKKGYKFMNIPDAIAPELRDEVYSLCKTNKIEDFINSILQKY